MQPGQQAGGRGGDRGDSHPAMGATVRNGNVTNAPVMHWSAALPGVPGTRSGIYTEGQGRDQRVTLNLRADRGAAGVRRGGTPSDEGAVP